MAPESKQVHIVLFPFFVEGNPTTIVLKGTDYGLDAQSFIWKNKAPNEKQEDVFRTALAHGLRTGRTWVQTCRVHGTNKLKALQAQAEPQHEPGASLLQKYCM